MEQLFGAIPSVLDGLDSNQRIDEAVVFAAWSRCAGELLQTRTAPLEFFENRLVIAVQDNTWRRHLEELSPQMLVKINGSVGQGTLKFIEFRVDEEKVNSSRISGKSSADHKDAQPKVAKSLSIAAKAISDEGLREQFLNAAAAYLAKQNKD